MGSPQQVGGRTQTCKVQLPGQAIIPHSRACTVKAHTQRARSHRKTVHRGTLSTQGHVHWTLCTNHSPEEDSIYRGTFSTGLSTEELCPKDSAHRRTLSTELCPQDTVHSVILSHTGTLSTKGHSLQGSMWTPFQKRHGFYCCHIKG